MRVLIPPSQVNTVSNNITDNQLLQASNVASKGSAVASVAADGKADLNAGEQADDEDDTKPAATPKFKIFISEDVVPGCW
jgi:hypothetical protein